jgi:hypothetical protein
VRLEDLTGSPVPNPLIRLVVGKIRCTKFDPWRRRAVSDYISDPTAIGLAMVSGAVFGRCRGRDFLARSARENQPGCRIGFPGLAMAIIRHGRWSIPYSALSRMDHRLHHRGSDSIMADAENTPEHDEAENVGLVYLRRIDAHPDSIERKLNEVVVRLATVERDVAAMRVRLDSLDGRVARIEGRVDLQREIAKLVAVLES